MPLQEGIATSSGALALKVIRGGASDPTPAPVIDPIDWPHVTNNAMKLSLAPVLRYGLPHKAESDVVNEWRVKNIPNLMRGFRRVALAKTFKIPTHFGALYVAKIAADGEVTPYGLASLRVVTDTGVGFIVDAFQNTVELENMKFHGMGTGGTAESAAQTALVTELTTEYNPNSTRATGTTVEGATANIYRTVGTNTIDSGTPAITEHGVFSQAATGGGVMIDRSLFAAINLAGGDGIQFTYELTFTSGG